VNNAAIESAYPYDKFEIDVIEKMTAVNLIAPMTLTRLLLPKMIKRSEGHIVNISSLTDRMSALNGVPGMFKQWANASLRSPEQKEN
jgi:short-subunit dehydrogenase